jgi:hypothetical protein
MASHAAKDNERHEAYILKQLRPVSAWQGSIVHQILATRFVDDFIVPRRPLDVPALTAAAQDLAQRQFAFSAARRYREPGQTKSAVGSEYCALVEHEHGEGVSPEALAVVHATLARCFANLASQVEFLAMLRAGYGHQVEVRLNADLGGSQLPTVTATVDLLFFRPDGQLTIVDWKVGQSETSDYARQVLVYALAVVGSRHWPDLVPEAIELYEVNLLRNYIQQHPVTTERLDETEDFVYRSLVDLDALVGGRRFDELDLSEFEVAERPSSCGWCNFRSLCVLQLEGAGRPTEAVAIQGRLW